MAANILPEYIHLDPPGRDQKVKAFFSERSHVAYQIKEKGA